ncbi:hypothetical protein LTR85_011863 [Meristemomyces frigidus]|nr:hypothetical protein LTR85_011863 [Meristemomyces frigidus]
MATASSSRTAVLAADIQRLGLPHPSFDGKASLDVIYPPDIENCRGVLVEAAQELVELVQGPRQLVRSQIMSQNFIYYDFIQKFDIARKVSRHEEGEVSYSDLAADTGLDISSLRRMLRFAIAHRVFVESRPDYVSHSAASGVLAEDDALRDWLDFMLVDALPSGPRAVEALAKWPGADEPSHTGYALAHGAPFWDMMAREPERGRKFAGAMRSFATGDDLSLRHVVNGYEWGGLGEAAKVVDVGGSTGETAFALTVRFPELHVVVQDVPSNIDQAKQHAARAVIFVAHDFFEPQPVKDADVYVLRWILHDWPDKYCLRILRALIPALKPGARVLIVDAVLPPVGTIPNLQDRIMRWVPHIEPS